MYFDDDYNRKKRNINLGNRNLSSKDDFMKKLRDNEKKQLEEGKLNQSNIILKSFIKKYFISRKKFSNSKLYDNLQSVKILLNTTNFNNKKNELIVLKSFEKTIIEINDFLSCRMIKVNDTNNLIKLISELFSYIEPNNFFILFGLNNLSFEYTKMLYKLIQISTKNVFESVKKDYLIEDNNPFFIFLNVLLINIQKKVKNLIIKKLSNNINYIYLINKIIIRKNKILNETNLKLFFEFYEDLISNIYLQRKFFALNGLNKFTNKIVDELLENYLISILSLSKNSFSKIKMIEICFVLENQDNIIEKISGNNLIQLFYCFIDEIEKIQAEKTTNLHFLFFIKIFQKLRKEKLELVERTMFLRGINLILEFLFKNKGNVNEENILYIIYYSAKLLQTLYDSNFEKSNYQSILDHIINKVVLKFCPKINEEILTYSVKLLEKIYPSIITNTKNLLQNNNNKEIKFLEKYDSKTIETNEILFEIISFFILNKIFYKSNYFFIEFKTTKNIYENLPFNYYYLNIISKYLITLFSDIMLKVNIDEIELLNQNMIIQCLKSLYNLDNDISFTPNKDSFWNNMELVSKISSSKEQNLLIEKMKIMPFIFPLNIRLIYFEKEFKRIKEENRNLILNNNFPDYDLYENDSSTCEMTIPRESIYNTTFMYYMQNLLNPYKKWKISFVDKLGNKELGIDAGGLFKEFIYKLTEEGFSNKEQLFIESESGFLLPNNDIYKLNSNYKEAYKFLGFITGKALIENIKIYPNFSPIFLNNILEIENSFNDMKSYDFELYKNLVNLKNYEGDVEKDMGLTFSISENNGNKTRNINLIDNGENIPVTNNNKFLYIKKVTEYKLYYQFKEQCQCFKDGLSNAVNMEILHIFTGDELRQIIYGFEKDVFDINDMRMSIELINWDLNNLNERQCLEDFFNILNEFDIKEKEKFLFFCTSLKRLPIGGFSKLKPKFKLAKAGIQIPTSSTCTNMLKLPVLPYKKLKDIILYVINADAGFYYA
jgi:ubiquitin-protein ligase E3 C